MKKKMKKKKKKKKNERVRCEARWRTTYAGFAFGGLFQRISTILLPDKLQKLCAAAKIASRVPV
ncbi:hypothetical protein N7530_008706 [Penicillium desertorum]|uniref:Uncharacterized protein n=1 Tax=Penicillium desertorum TaxID=1303715 RepID=A0A9W9WPN9_9EURO|nr:hypothetical protein N7530_008706 [Penicillium desertorum]